MQAADETSIPGFRFFNDHDPRILEECLNDHSCAKVILTRNALDSYVSRKIAAVTGQWKLTNLKHKKTAQIEFDAGEFAKHLEEVQRFQVKVLNALQVTGQTGFYIGYDDINSLEVLNGLARFLGSKSQVEAVNTDLKKQNPKSLEGKVSNYSEMTTALTEIDFLGLSRTPNFEPRRGPGVPQFVLGDRVPIIFMPISGGPVENVSNWLAAQEGCAVDELPSGMNQKELRIWRRKHPGFRIITVLRHPVLRAYLGFCDVVLGTERGAYRELRKKLIQQFDVGVPTNSNEQSGYDVTAHKAAFIAFLKFLKLNLTNQTSLRIDPTWASQTSILDGATGVAVPSNVIHERELDKGVDYLQKMLGLPGIPVEKARVIRQFNLSDVYDADIETQIREIYARDYLNFGFSNWSV
ncbi:MAG: hypothetical protein ACI92A_002412 [Candidatus Paceibacteria bacterium]